jgi:ribosomal protein L25 (general stress protein Ctc)
MIQNKPTVAHLWATRSQLAERYQVHPRTIDEWRRQGNLPAVVYGTRLVRFDITACDEWFNQFRHAAKWEQVRNLSV